MEVRAVARYVRVSPRKARIVIDQIRGKSVEQAREILRFTNRGIAETTGDIVAIIDDGATVKRFFREADHIRLQPENSTMDPIITTDCSIAGKVVAVFRRL